MTTSFSELRTDIATVITAIGTPWNLAKVPYSQFDVGGVPDAVPASKAHGCFAVGMPDSERTEGRQRVATGAATLTRVVVRFFARYLPKDGIASEDTALDLERTMIAAVVAVATDFQIYWESSTRTSTDPGNWFVHEVAFIVNHRISLT